MFLYRIKFRLGTEPAIHRLLSTGIVAFALSIMFGSSVGPTSTCLAFQTPSAEGLEFFEKRVRPLLLKQCMDCHGAEKSESDFRMDSRAAILRGGASDQPGAIPGDPANSLIIRSIEHSSDYEMPPAGKLEPSQIAVLSKWVRIGLPWPEQTHTATQLTIEQRVDLHRKTHWAFQPIRKPELTAVESGRADFSVGNNNATSPPQPGFGAAIDALLRRRLKEKRLDFSPIADRRTLIRRATFDLTGLPPSYQQVQEFVNDPQPDAFARLIERLLDSPAYGERWARHWLDVARYADTCGYDFENVDRSYPFAYTYRDYVIESFNQDLPYDQFIREQLAADLLGKPKNDRSLAALGFITVGRRYTTRIDTIDDQVDVVTRGLMGLTVSCARCHDHKYDGIPTSDYYSLFGVFNNCEQPEELPRIGTAPDNEHTRAYANHLAKLKQDLQNYRVKTRDEIRKQTFTHIYDTVFLTLLPDMHSQLRKQGIVKIPYGQVRDELNNQLRKNWLAKLNDKNSSLFKWGQKIGPNNPKSKRIKAVTQIGARLTQLIKRWNEASAPDDALKLFEGEELDLAKLIFAVDSPLSRPEFISFNKVEEAKKLRKTESKIRAYYKQTPDGVDHAMVIRDKQKLTTSYVMIRGNPHRTGKRAPRQFLSVLSQSTPKAFPDHTSGRLELAEKITSPDNPLTARVIVNRFWMHHFSQPLVDTPSDFGIRCEQPAQHQLLDYLAADLIENHWSLKHLHRRIMLSMAYQQTSQSELNVTGTKTDPTNQLYWRMNRRRLEIESLRDSILHVSGRLNRKQGGRGRAQFSKPFDRRRTIYGHIDRQKLPGELRVFDLASPDQSSAKRLRTTVPQQNLFLMNSELVIQESKALASQFSKLAAPEQISGLFQKILSRNPSAQEREIITQFLQPIDESGIPKSPQDIQQLSPLEQLSQMMLMTNEFEIID